MKKFYSVRIKFKNEDGAAATVKQVFGVERFNHLNIGRGSDGVYYSATLNTDKELSSARLEEIMAQCSFIESIERCDEQ